MAHFHKVGVNIEARNVSLRALLRNLQDVAIGKRLDRIKCALDTRYASNANSDKVTTTSEGSAKTPAGKRRPVERPVTPKSSASALQRKSERGRKRRNLGAV